MPFVVPTDEPGVRWDQTPKSTISTQRYKIAEGPSWSKARAVQDRAYDWALQLLYRQPELEYYERDRDCLQRRLTDARRVGELPRENGRLQRAAVQQARMAFTMIEAHWEGLEAKMWQEEEGEEGVGKRALRQLTRGPKPIEEYLRGNKKKGKRRSVAVLDGVKVVDGGWKVKVAGLGTYKLGEKADDGIRSVQLVEDKWGRWLHAQYGEELPEAKPLDGPAVGGDLGLVHTLTTSLGEHLHRPDTSALQTKRKGLFRHRAKCCTYGSRAWYRYGAQARKLGKRIQGIQQEWERQVAIRLSAAFAVIGLENLQLLNMVASGKGTASVPGSRRKRGLNRELLKQRMGKTVYAIMRRCLKDGTWLMLVNPVNTSIKCSECGHKDKESRKKEAFLCTQCGHAMHADQNAARNIEARARNLARGMLARRRSKERTGAAGSAVPGVGGPPTGKGHTHPGEGQATPPAGQGATRRVIATTRHQA